MRSSNNECVAMRRKRLERVEEYASRGDVARVGFEIRVFSHR